MSPRMDKDSPLFRAEISYISSSGSGSLPSGMRIPDTVSCPAKGGTMQYSFFSFPFSCSTRETFSDPGSRNFMGISPETAPAATKRTVSSVPCSGSSISFRANSIPSGVTNPSASRRSAICSGRTTVNQSPARTETASYRRDTPAHSAASGVWVNPEKSAFFSSVTATVFSRFAYHQSFSESFS